MLAAVSAAVAVIISQVTSTLAMFFEVAFFKKFTNVTHYH